MSTKTKEIDFWVAGFWFTNGTNICRVNGCGKVCTGSLAQASHLSKHVNNGTMTTATCGSGRSLRTTYGIIPS